MKWVGSWFVAVPVVATVLMGCGQTDANLDVHRETVGESGILHFEIDADVPLSTGKNELRITIHEADTNVPWTTAMVELSAVMPAMAHDAPDVPMIEELGAGAYLARDVALPMPGRWEVHVQASRESKQDKATFAYDLR